MNQAIHAFFNFNKYAEIGKITNFGYMYFPPDSVLQYFPRGSDFSCDATTSCSFTVKRKNNSFHFVANKSLVPNVDVATNSFLTRVSILRCGSNFYKCAVIGYHNHFAFYLVANF